jgi:acyl-coenzyme A thioesterase PaaI-like protein
MRISGLVVERHGTTLTGMETTTTVEPPQDSTIPAVPQSQSTLHALHCGCFACGASNPVGLRLEYSLSEEGIATAKWEPSADFRSYEDRIHGGVLATLLDGVMVHALFATGVVGVTAELTIRYLQSVEVGVPVEVTGWVKSSRFGIHLCAAEIRQANKLAVKASAKFMAIKASSAAQ